MSDLIGDFDVFSERYVLQVDSYLKLCT